jgi:hypothetical protein
MGHIRSNFAQPSVLLRKGLSLKITSKKRLLMPSLSKLLCDAFSSANFKAKRNNAAPQKALRNATKTLKGAESAKVE